MFAKRSLWLGARRFLISPPCRKFLATWNVHPSIRGFTKSLMKTQPKISLSPNQLRVLYEPEQFYKTILLSALDAALRRNPTLQLFLQLDFNRSTRPGPSSTAKVLLPLLRDFPSRVNVFMFRSPALSGIAAKTVPPRFNEGWGTWHAKIYGADDEVVISGANLNKSYFSNRQDRYVHITGSTPLAHYCYTFLRTVSAFSFKLLPLNSQRALNPYSVSHEDYTLQWLDPDTHPHHVHKEVQRALVSFHRSLTAESAPTGPDSNRHPLNQDLEPRIALFPVIQAGQFGIREEENVLELLFHILDSYGKTSSRRPLLDLTSGYFGLYGPYRDLILKSSNVDTRIVCSAPKANGFFGSKGISGRIPEGYTYLEQQFVKAVNGANRGWIADPSGGGRGVQLREWEKDDWTYHAKGIWLSPSHGDLPVLTMFGSTNLNSRSAHLDTELSFVMVIPSEPPEQSKNPESSHLEQSNSLIRLRRQLQLEIDKIREHVAEWKGAQRNVRRLTKAIVHVVKGML
ncbi:hypothetical protein F5887DRAFT_918348 [Amanita rubescens]|nr:hypothetical protein F5887DRAFT_918348 [Amanita rubescens]